MTAKDAILQMLNMAQRVTTSYLADLSKDDLLLRPVGGQNHVAWQLGHLITSERNMLETIKPGASPSLPEGFDAGHGRDKTAVDDASLYHAPEEYIKLFYAQREATKKVLDELSDAELDAPAAESMQRMCQTVGAVFVLMGSHELMHVGQYVGVRRKLDKAIAI